MIFTEIKSNNENYPVVIIGSGPAGLSLALELEKHKISCLVIEAGDISYSKTSQKLYEGKVNGIFPNDLSKLRYRKYGGTFPSYNHYLKKKIGIIRPLDDYDFQKWPINTSDLDKYLNKACSYLKIKNIFREKDLNDDLKLIEFSNSSVNFAETYTNLISQSKYISLIINLQFNKFIGNGPNVDEIECLTKSFKKIKIKSNLFVLGCGGIENSRLLLWSKEISNLNLNNLPIGNYWMEHPFLKKIATIKDKNKNLINLLDNDMQSHTGFLDWGNKTYSLSPTKKYIKKNSILNAGLFITIHQRNNDTFKNIGKNLLSHNNFLSKSFLNLINKNIFNGATISSSWEQEALFHSNITLDNSNDIFNIPKVILNYKKGQLTHKTILKCLDALSSLLKNNNSGILNINHDLIKKNDYISEAGYHHIGGTIMGNNHYKSVVDSNLKVHNLNNLFVIGSSVFPSGGHANPTLTIIQLSLRLADHLKLKYFHDKV